MSASIHFKGTDYDSVEAMPPSIRAAYEQSQRDKARPQSAQDDEKDDEDEEDDKAVGNDDEEQPEPAWGGARSGRGVPVPAEFEQVIGLGPAAGVVKRGGIQLLPDFGTPRAHVYVRYGDGFAYRTSGKDIHIWRWDEIVAIQSDLAYGSQGHEHRGHTLTKNSGEQVILDEGLLRDDGRPGVGNLDHTKAAVFALLGPPLAERYRVGEALTFGTVTIHRLNGLQVDGKTYAWDGIQEIKVVKGRFKIALTDGQHHELRTSKIPNFELLCQMIGLNLLPQELWYW